MESYLLEYSLPIRKSSPPTPIIPVASVGTNELRRSVATASSVPIKTPVTGVTVDGIGQFLIASGRLSVTARTFKLRQPLGRGRERWERPRGECGRDSCLGAGTCSQEA